MEILCTTTDILMGPVTRRLLEEVNGADFHICNGMVMWAITMSVVVYWHYGWWLWGCYNTLTSRTILFLEININQKSGKCLAFLKYHQWLTIKPITSLRICQYSIPWTIDCIMDLSGIKHLARHGSYKQLNAGKLLLLSSIVVFTRSGFQYRSKPFPFF